MRPAFLLSFALISTAAFAQTHTVASVAPDSAMAAGIHGANPAAAAVAVKLPRIITHQYIRAVVDSDFAHPLMSSTDPSLSYSFGAPTDTTAPRLVRASGLSIPQAEIVTADKETKVAVHLVVDRNGVPGDLSIAQSAGKNFDEAALQTVKDYRFEPATVNHIPVEAPVTVTVTIDKQ
ncbi:MAG: TonB family protein [Acidobacteriaceae bacterium]|nr:TonB family protein [Acidobacteriaceae bacterium]